MSTTPHRFGLSLGLIGALLVGCAGADDAADGDASEDALSASAPAFAGTGSAPVTIAGLASTRVGVSSSVAKLMNDMGTIGQGQNVNFVAGTFKLPVSAFADGSSPGTPNHPVGFDLMFQTLGANEPDVLQWFPQLSTENDTYSCTMLQNTKNLTSLYLGFHAYREAFDNSERTAAQRATLTKSAKAAIASFKKGSSGHLVQYVQCHWDNTDDTDADALLRIDNDSGEVRVLVSFAGA